MTAAPQDNIVPTLDSVLDRFNGRVVDMEALKAALVEREDTIADTLRMAGRQFGLFPQIVAEVLAEVQIGSPMPEDQRAMIRQQFVTLMQQVEAAQRGEGPMPTP